MTLESAMSFLAAVFLFGITPGPGVFAILARALVGGVGSCALLALGMVVSDIIYLVAACLGLAVIATLWGDAFTVIRIVGAVYLIYLGWRMWRAPLDLEGENAKGGATGMALSFVQGFLISASNPKVILFYIAFLPTFMDLAALDAGDILLASALTLIGLMLGLMMIALFAAKARRFFRTQASVQTLNRSAGSIMIGAGVFLATKH
ncbi:Leucine efflux protein [Halomonas sp. THAF5a]|uniref:LysE family translocator n=1 Tax=Halomonas sp. THAF5a TaxID=2587844 RepID=UPI001267B0E4|nr:LysE family translocator [Halomonas sp. THAF5a]QFU00344.1 Leucine efflux protein [Halomonas sp. THAF5a]